MERCCERRGVGEACVNAYGGGSDEPYEDVFIILAIFQ